MTRCQTWRGYRALKVISTKAYLETCRSWRFFGTANEALLPSKCVKFIGSERGESNGGVGEKPARSIVEWVSRFRELLPNKCPFRQNVEVPLHVSWVIPSPF